MFDQLAQCIRVNAYVGIDKGQKRTSRCSGANVPGKRWSSRYRPCGNDEVSARRSRAGRISTRIVNNDKLPRSAVEITAFQRADAGSEMCFRVVRWNDYRQVNPVRHFRAVFAG